jgi:hypothetical protein
MKKNNNVKREMVRAVALSSCAAAWFMTTSLVYANDATVGNDRVFELLIYHAMPGKERLSSRSFGRLQR